MEWGTRMALGMKNKRETKGWKHTIDTASVKIRCDFSLAFLRYERYEPWRAPMNVEVGLQSKELVSYLVLSVDWGYGWQWATVVAERSQARYYVSKDSAFADFGIVQRHISIVSWVFLLFGAT